MVITFFGSRNYSEKQEDKEKIFEILDREIQSNECYLYVGNYGPFDYFAKKCCMEYRKTHRNVKLILIIPYYKHDISNKEDFDEIIYPPLEKVPKRYCIVRKNQWAIDRADFVICYTWSVFNSRNLLEYTIKKHKRYENLAKPIY